MPKQALTKIVFLDAGTVDYGDISLRDFKRLGKFKAYRLTPLQKIVSRIQAASIVMTNKCRLNAEILSKARLLKLIVLAATGTNNVDLDYCRKHQIAVANVAGYSTESVVQFTFAFLLSLAGNLNELNKASHDGTWSRSPFFSLPGICFHEIRGRILGIIGYGDIGSRVAQIARTFGMQVLIGKIPGRIYSNAEKKNRISIETLMKKSDFVSLHAPLTPLTEKIINARTLRMMKREAFLINMARGGLVDEKALRQALISRKIAGAACDVLSQEPPARNHILLNTPNLLLTPHIAWASLEAREQLVREMAENIRAFQAGRKRSRVV
ncbi:MAG: glycerate dehydrogenase [Candidatus Omnitrophica bacterium]|nr:glycerate dehydrogenase [Candidatus Omnitrophota bacterium]